MNTEKVKALILLGILLLSLFHFGVAVQGYQYYNGLPLTKGVNYQLKNFFPIFLAIIIGGAFQFICTLILMIQIYNGYWSSYGRHVLVSFDLLITFCLSVIISILASRVSIKRGYFSVGGSGSNDQFETFYPLCISDAALTFVLQFLYLVILYGSTLEDFQHDNKVVKQIHIRTPKKSPKRQIEGQKPRLRFMKKKY